MAQLETWTTRLFLLIAGISLPVCVFYPNTPNVTFSTLGLISLGLLIGHRELRNLIPPLRTIALFIFLALWALLACFWSDNPQRSLMDVAKIAIALLGAISFYAAQTTELQQRFTKWYTSGFNAALLLLILDEILDTRFLRALRGPYTDTPEYYHSITLLIFSLWPFLNTLKERHAGIKALLIALLLLAVFEMTDHAAKLALVVALVAWGITYINPKFFLRLAGVLSALIMLAFPLALKDMNPLEVIHNNEFILLKPSYHHRLFILKRATNIIFESPWIGHGLDGYRNKMQKHFDPSVGEYLNRVIENGPNATYNLEILSQTTHPHNLSLQIWIELGLVGAIIYALFLLTSLWRLSNIPDRRYELATFMGLYTSLFTIAHISFGAWQSWWLFSVGIILSTILWQITKRKLSP